MTVGAKIATVNSKEVQLDAPVVIVNGRTLAPARFVAETFGYTVQWDSENKIVKITGSTEFYKDYSDLPDYGSFSGATLLGNEKIDVDGFVGQGIYTILSTTKVSFHQEMMLTENMLTN